MMHLRGALPGPELVGPPGRPQALQPPPEPCHLLPAITPPLRDLARFVAGVGPRLLLARVWEPCADRSKRARWGRREGRILARRRRVNERLAAMREEGGEGGVKDVAEASEDTARKKQTQESKQRLARLNEEHRSDLTNIQLGGDDRENKRRVEEEDRHQELRGKLLAEAEHSARQNASVAMRWADLFSYEVPQELFEEIRKQRASCNMIIESKEQLIQEMKAELKGKDDDYVKSLKRQADDIDLMISHMSQQFKDMQKSYHEELIEIENAFLQERMETLSGNKDEMSQLFEKRNQREQQFMDMMLEQAENYQKQLEELRVIDAEDYNILKIRLETDIQNLEQHLETMRATYQLNTEKLEYNYRVLVERDQENQSTINQQKRKIARQRDLLSNLKTKYGESDKRFQDQNSKLTDEYKRITEQFKDLQIKFRHFKESDTKRYKEVWKMNEEKVAAVVQKVLQADKIVHEHHLGLEWWPPSKETFAAFSFEDSNTTTEELDAEGLTEEEVRKRQMDERLEMPKFAEMNELLLEEALFLADRKKVEDAAGGKPELVERALLENILQALGVTDAASMDALLAALTVSGDIDTDQPEMIPLDDVASRLKAFVQSDTAALASAAAGGSKAVRLAAAKRKQQDKDKEYWERMANVIDPKMRRIWGCLEKNLQAYSKSLAGRQGALRDVQALGKENTELKILLSQYLSASINEELQVPPTQLI